MTVPPWSPARKRGTVPKSRVYRAASRATASRLQKKQRTQLAARTPSASGHVTTTSSPAYW